MNKQLVILTGTLLVLFSIFSFASDANAAELGGNFELEAGCLSPVSAEWSLKNTSDATETYEIGAEGDAAPWINLNGKWIATTPLKVTLNSNATAKLYAFIKPSCSTAAGNYNLILVVTNGETLNKTVIVKVSQLSALDLKAEKSTLEAGQCESAAFKISATNTGALNEEVVVSVSGLPAEMNAEISPETFSLDKNKTKEFEVKINADCDAKLGNNSFSVSAETKTALKKSINLTFSVIDRQNIEISSGSLVACRNELTMQEITLKNSGAESDELTFNISGLNWASTNDEKITLAAGEEKNIEILFAKTGEDAGQYKLTFEATSLKFSKTYSKEIEVKLQDCYSVMAELVSGSPEACVESPYKATFKITNNGTKKLEINAKIEGLKATLSPKSFEIEPQDSLNIEAEFDFSDLENSALPLPSEYTLVLEGENLALKSIFPLVLNDCQNLSVNAAELEKTLEIEAGKEPTVLTASVSNNGAEPQKIEVSVEGPEWVYFNPAELEVNAGESNEIYVYASPSPDTKNGEYTATLKLSGAEFNETKEIKFNVSGGAPAEETQEETPSETTETETPENTESGEVATTSGFALLSQGGPIVLIMLFVVIVSLLVYLSRNGHKTAESSGLSELRDEVMELEGKDDEEDLPIAKKRKISKAKKPKRRR